MTTENKLFETYIKFKPKPSRCILEQIVLWADRLDEASIGSLYKASVFFGPDDIKFLQQFPRRWWVSALYQRYNNHQSGFKSLYNYLLDLHKMREEIVKREFPKIYEQEVDHFHNTAYYKTMDKSLLDKLAYDHARVGANREAYRTINTEKYPPPDGDQDFIFRDGKKPAEVYRANPFIGDLVKKIEGTFDNEDGFDLSNPTRKVVKDVDPETGKEEESAKTYTDGFNFPNVRTIRNMIQEYLKYIGHGIIRLDDSDLDGAQVRPDKEPGRNPKGSEDTLTKEMIVRDLKKQYKITDKEANERFLELVRQGAVKGINDSDLNEKGVGQLLLPHKKQQIKRVVNGEIVVEETDNPVLGSGHFIRRLKKEEADAVERVLRNDDPSEEDQRIYQAIEQRIRGWHYDVTTEPQGTDEAGKKLPGRSRPIYIDSSHEGGSHRQGSDNIVAGGWNPNQETDGRKFLTKHGAGKTEAYQAKINKLFRLYLTDDEGNFLMDDAGNLIPNPNADNDGSQLRQEIEKQIDRRLSRGEEFRQSSSVHRNSAPERLVMASARNLIVQSVFRRIMERLGNPNIELHNALGRSVRNGIVEDELNDLAQQNISGRGSRRRRDAEQKGVVYPITDISDISKWAEYVGCETDPDYRKMGSSRCAFSYDLDKLVDRTKYLSGDINAIAKNVHTNHEVTADDIQSQIFKMRDNFSEAFAHLEQSFYVKLMAENQAKTDRQLDQSVIDSVKRKTYGPSGDGSDGDFSGFDNPEAAKAYFMKHFSRKAVDDKHFSYYVQTYRHSDIQVSDELSVMQTAKNMTMEFLTELYEKYMPKDSFNYNASLIGHITQKVESNVAEAAKLLNMVPDMPAEEAPSIPAPEEESGQEPMVGLSMINDLKNQLDNNPLNYEMISRQAVENLGKRYPEEIPTQIKTLIDKAKIKIQNAIYKADAAIRNKTFVHIDSTLLKLLPTDKLEALIQAADQYQQIKKFGILNNIIEKMRNELKQR